MGLGHVLWGRFTQRLGEIAGSSEQHRDLWTPMRAQTAVICKSGAPDDIARGQAAQHPASPAFPAQR